MASDWSAFALTEDIVRERYSALLAALEELSTRGPRSTLREIADQLRTVGFHDALLESDLRTLLEKLAAWGFAEPFRDFAAPVRNYHGVVSRQEAWALTRHGRTIVAAVRTAVSSSDRALQLPSRLLDSVEQTLRTLLEHTTDAGAHGLLDADLSNVKTRIAELQRVTADFYDALGQLVQSDVTKDEVFGGNRDRVVEALRQFAREYDRGLVRVGSALKDLRHVGHQHVVECAVVHAGLLDPAAQQHWVAEQVSLLSALEAWFVPEGSVHRLIESAYGAVNTVLNAVDRRYNARLRGSDLSADFRILAQSLYRQTDDDAAQRVYAAAFGDWPAWHVVAGQPQENVEFSTIAAAGSVPFTSELTLREHERHGPPGGRPRKIVDASTERQQALDDARAQAEYRQRCAEALLTPGEVALDHFAGLDAETAAVLFDSLQLALDMVDPATGTGQAEADEAGVLIAVRVVDPDRWVTVPLEEGDLRGPDLRVRVVPAGTSLPPPGPGTARTRRVA
ncbi:TIGR02677 family protein [Amycolatopsis xylanica]|uniref:TIGR02677 family protein n=1 Tax=Amycolatopsis xylanica TaxID=589385 RepID=A0A1H2SGU2_9PSEU|nr:TIGR02677 family protein [Amycolatopsis xylanica]